MVQVWHYRGWNHKAGDNTTPPSKATADFIEKHGYEKIEVTGEDVPDDAVDADGRFNPDA